MQRPVKPKKKRIVRIQVAEMVTRPSGTGTQVKPGTYAAVTVYDEKADKVTARIAAFLKATGHEVKE